MTIEIASLNGISKDIAMLIAKKNDKVLNGKGESLFNKVNQSALELVQRKNLTISTIVQTLYNIGSTIFDYFKNSAFEVLSFCKNVAAKIYNKYMDLFSHNGNREDIVNAAEGYVGKINDRKCGNAVFSGGVDEEWCADTASYIIKDVAGAKLPNDFGSSRVAGLQEWGNKHKCYKETSGMTNNQRAEYIKTHVKPGDIMIERRNNKSHARIVVAVHDDGTLDVVEGNTAATVKGDKTTRRLVKRTRISPDINTLSGFVHLEKWLG